MLERTWSSSWKVDRIDPKDKSGVRTLDLCKLRKRPQPCWSVLGVWKQEERSGCLSMCRLWGERLVNEIWEDLLLCVTALLLPAWENSNVSCSGLLALDFNFFLYDTVLRPAKSPSCFIWDMQIHRGAFPGFKKKRGRKSDQFLRI